MSEECPSCENEYKVLSTHWQRSKDCSEPELSDKQKQIVTGLAMGDGSVVVPNRNPSLHMKMINEEFLAWLDKELKWLSNGYTLTQTAEEAAKQNRESGFSENAKADNYNSKYTLRTKCSEQLFKWREWYSTGQKIFPEDLDMTPLTLKMWYCCDGSKESYNKLPHMSISCYNEEENFDKVYNYFSEINVEPVPHSSQRSFAIRFNQSDSKLLWDYMGEPPNGFEHKWP